MYLFNCMTKPETYGFRIDGRNQVTGRIVFVATLNSSLFYIVLHSGKVFGSKLWFIFWIVIQINGLNLNIFSEHCVHGTVSTGKVIDTHGNGNRVSQLKSLYKFEQRCLANEVDAGKTFMPYVTRNTWVLLYSVKASCLDCWHVN